MADTPKFDRINLINGYKVSDKAKLVNTNYNFSRSVTDEAIGTFYPYDIRSFNSTDIFLYDENSGYPLEPLPSGQIPQWSYSGTRRTPKSNLDIGPIHSGDGEHDITMLGKEIIYGIPYVTYSYRSGHIRSQAMLMLVHTMQSLNPYYSDFSQQHGFQWNLNFDPNVDYTLINDILYYPKKHFRLLAQYDENVDTITTYMPQPHKIGPYEYNSVANNGPIYSDNIIGVYCNENVPLYQDIPINLSNFDFNSALIANCRFGGWSSDFYKTNRNIRDYLNIHNVKHKTVNSNVDYYYTDDDTEMIIYQLNGITRTLRFNFKLLPTSAAVDNFYHEDALPITMSFNNIYEGYDCREFINAYSGFLYGDSAIWPAYNNHDNDFDLDSITYLPTIPVSDTSEMIYSDTYHCYYAPVDTAKCEEIMHILENICSTAVSEVLLVPAHKCPEYVNRPTDTVYTKNTTISMTTTQDTPKTFL